MADDDLTGRIARGISARTTRDLAATVRGEGRSTAIAAFYEGPVKDAFAELKHAFEAHGRRVMSSISDTGASFQVVHEDRTETDIRLAIAKTDDVVSYRSHRPNKDGSVGAVEDCLREPGGATVPFAHVDKRRIIALVMGEWETVMQGP